MNIKEAKEQIQNAMRAYFTKDAFGDYAIPIERQRPVFLMGPPGIGKTAIMEQIAAELGVGLVTYSMTHHTRQSALGLPFIVQKTYGGKEYSVSEYTMSEIIASVYDMMEQTGLKEGILFLDEINCVSETLAPAMLQFLQYKIFGRHTVPAGWIVVTAGNPPEYNNSVREFDIVTWDRLKRIDVEPDYNVWKEYAVNKGVHAAVTTYLDIRKDDFYRIETTVDGKSFVTARGWDDLSDMIKLFEQNDIPVKQALVEQYLQNKKIARSFAVYYDLFRKYRSDYQVDKILSGHAPQTILERAKNAQFDERLSLLGLLLDSMTTDTRDVIGEQETLTMLMEHLQEARKASNDSSVTDALKKRAEAVRREIRNGQKASSLSPSHLQKRKAVVQYLEMIEAQCRKTCGTDNAQALQCVKTQFDALVQKLREHAKSVGEHLNNAFAFCEQAFGNDSQEILILVTELTIHKAAAQFIARYGCDAYFAHNKELLFYERQKEIIAELDALDGALGEE